MVIRDRYVADQMDKPFSAEFSMGFQQPARKNSCSVGDPDATGFASGLNNSVRKNHFPGHTLERGSSTTETSNFQVTLK